MICPECNTKNKSNAKKCTNCGTRLDSEIVSNVVRTKDKIIIKPRKKNNLNERNVEEVIGNFDALENIEEIPKESIEEKVEPIVETIAEPTEVLDIPEVLDNIPEPQAPTVDVITPEVIPQVETLEEIEVDTSVNQEIPNVISIDEATSSFLDNIDSIQIVDSISGPEVLEKISVEDETEEPKVEVKEEIKKEEPPKETKKEQKTVKKKSSNLPYIIVGGVLLALLIVCIALIIYNKRKENANVTVVATNTTFFLENKEGKFAVFDDNGNKITDFIFTDHSAFFNGTAIVYNGKKVGVINESGQFTINYDTYKAIENVTNIYKVSTKEYDYYLVDSLGKVLYDLNDKDVTTFSDEDNYSVVSDKKSYYIINENGKLIKQLNNKEDIIPYTNDKNGLISIFYDGKNYIYDLKNIKEISSFDSEKQFCIDSLSDDKKTVILNSCSEEAREYKIISNDKVTDISQDCSKLSFDNNTVICENDSEYLLNEDGSIGIEIGNKLYIDDTTYAESSRTTTDFYKDGEIVNSLNCKIISESKILNDDIYLIKGKYGNGCAVEGYEYYDVNGNKLNDKSYKDAKPFDDNKVSIVSDDGNNYYLINESLEKISDDYEKIKKELDYYITVKNNLKGVIDSNGKLLLDNTYNELDIIEVQHKMVAKMINEYGKIIVYDLDNNKELVSSGTNIELTDHYMEIKKEDKIEYYTYSGKKFYEK